jgi:predicted dehydrogenase
VRATAANVGALNCREEIEVAVLASPPEARMAALDAFPNLRAVLMEKPLAPSLSEARAVVEACRARGIMLAVNLMRRADPAMGRLAGGELQERVGQPQVAFAVYGNGLENNGVHLIDLVRMLIGEVGSAQAVAADDGESFVLRCAGGVTVMAQSIDFTNYRELGLDIWGTCGRLSIVLEGLTLVDTQVGPHRYAQGERELIHDAATVGLSGLGSALYGMYDNLAAALENGAPLFCSGDDALCSAAVIDAIRRSAAGGGEAVNPAS